MLDVLEPAALPLEPVPPPLARIQGLPGAWSRSLPPGASVPLSWPGGCVAGAVRSGLVFIRAWVRPGRFVLVGPVGPGGLFAIPEPGIRSPAGGRPARAPWFEALAPVPARIVQVPAAELFGAVHRDAGLALWFAAAVAAQSAADRARLAVALSLPVTDRLVHALAELGTILGRRYGRMVRVDVPLTQDLLASLVGSTRESVNRALVELAGQGRVRRRGRHYWVCSETGG
jgi:CRP-like cAMP-binding protein